MVGEAGIEPTTVGLEGRCSIQLSYSPRESINGAIAIVVAAAAASTVKLYARAISLLRNSATTASSASPQACLAATRLGPRAFT